MKTVLYAEDREDDVFFLRRACRRAGLAETVEIRSVPDGIRAVAYLRGEGEFADRNRNPVPELVLLDLKMPGRSGLDVLEWIRATPRFAELPVFLLTSSNQQADMQRADSLKANGYFVKPGGVAELSPFVHRVAHALGLTLPTPD